MGEVGEMASQDNVPVNFRNTRTLPKHEILLIISDLWIVVEIGYG